MIRPITPLPAPPTLAIIIVNWNVRELLRACLRSVISYQSSVLSPQSSATAKLKTENCELTTEIIVVDNASTDGSTAMLATEYPGVHVIANADNRGFTRANNQGLAMAAGRYVLFLNPDTVVVGDALARMVAYLDAHPQVGALGPQLRYADGSLQSSRRRFPTLATALFESTPLAWHWPANPWARWYLMADAQTFEVSETSKVSPGEEVDWLVGAALLVRREVLTQIGGFDEGYFMYSEELDWCRRAKSAGWQIVYLPQAVIVHHEGKSSEQVVAARHIRFQTSRVYYFRKFHGPVRAEILRVSILGMFAVEWASEAAKWLAGSRRPLRRERMAAYGQLLRTGLKGLGIRDQGLGTSPQSPIPSP